MYKIIIHATRRCTCSGTLKYKQDNSIFTHNALACRFANQMIKFSNRLAFGTVYADQLQIYSYRHRYIFHKHTVNSCVWTHHVYCFISMINERALKLILPNHKKVTTDNIRTCTCDCYMYIFFCGRVYKVFLYNGSTKRP